MADHWGSCEVEMRRQEIVFNSKTSPGNSPRGQKNDPNDQLPVVEVKPFRKQEWRRAKSLPAYYDAKLLRIAAQQHAAAVAASQTFRILSPRQILESYRSQSQQASRMRRNDRKVKVSPRELTSQSAKESKFFDKPPKFGFVNIPERSKTTMEEIRSGTSENIYYSCLSRAMSQEDMTKQQNLKLNGHRFRKQGTRVVSQMKNFYADPESRYQYQRSYTMPLQTELDFLTRNIYGWETPGLTEAGDESNYDTVSRAHTLPSIEIRNAPVKLRVKNRQMQQQLQNASRQSSPAKGMKNDNAFRLGGIQNTLQVLNETGKPLGIEQHLTMQIKSTLEHIRRTKDAFPPPPSLASTQRGPPRFSAGVPTHGEMLLREGLKHNKKGASHKPRAEQKVEPPTPRDAISRATHLTSRASEARPQSHQKSENHDSGIQSPADQGFHEMCHEYPEGNHVDHPEVHDKPPPPHELEKRLQDLVVEDYTTVPEHDNKTDEAQHETVNNDTEENPEEEAIDNKSRSPSRTFMTAPETAQTGVVRVEPPPQPTTPPSQPETQEPINTPLQAEVLPTDPPETTPPEEES